ncbi:MAG: rhomboid family intramembrane serine protease [Candidatus Eisenbacteria bacterium]
MIPIRDENPPQRVPVVTRALIVINVAAFLYQLLLGPRSASFLQGWGVVPDRLTDAFMGLTPAPRAVVTLFTSMFLHGGWVHLIGNMWYLWIFGDNVEDELGSMRFMGFYLVAGVVSALMHVFFNPGSPVPTIGASGAIAGVLGAYAFAFPKARVVTLVPIIFFFQIVALPALLVLGLWFVFQFFSATLFAGGGTGGVAWWAHIGGFVFGIVAMATLRRRPRSAAWVEK